MMMFRLVCLFVISANLFGCIFISEPDVGSGSGNGATFSPEDGWTNEPACAQEVDTANCRHAPNDSSAAGQQEQTDGLDGGAELDVGESLEDFESSDGGIIYPEDAEDADDDSDGSSAADLNDLNERNCTEI